jgi:hypothetical protein
MAVSEPHDTAHDIPILDLEAWDLPDTLSPLDCLVETGTSGGWSQAEVDMEDDR